MQLTSIHKGMLFLLLSSFLFATMGVLIRHVSLSVNNESIVFYRNLFGLMCLLPWYALVGFGHLKTEHLSRHWWRALIGLSAMYCFFYAIAHLKLSNAMVFTYSSPVFIPLVAWLLLREKVSAVMLLASLLGLLGVWLVAKPDAALLSPVALVGAASSILAAVAFVTVRQLSITEPAVRIVFYFCLFATGISAIPLLWAGHALSLWQLQQLALIGLVATLSQLAMSHAYKYASAAQISPVNYMAIIFAGVWAALLWAEYPSWQNVLGMLIIFFALLMLTYSSYKEPNDGL